MADKNDKTGGYNVHFVKPLDARYKCAICSLALRSPFQTECGHRFCEECIKETITSGPKICPVDKSPLSLGQIFKDAFCNREILEMECFCTNKALGCKWTGQLRKMKEEHYGECEFVELDCLNDQCKVKIQRGLMPKHLAEECLFKKTPCPYCGREVPHKLMEKHHNEECPKIKLPCPKGCPATVAREEMEHHIQQTCPNAESSCPFLFGACEYQGSKAGEKKHLQENKVVDARLIEEMIALQTAIQSLEKRMNSFNMINNQTKHQNCPFRVLWDVGQWNGGKPVTIIDRHMPINGMAKFDESLSRTWKINRFQSLFDQAATRTMLSIDTPPFCFKGYKLCARVYPNGHSIGVGTHLSLFFVVMRGADDDLLPWPFQQRVSFELIDQSGDQQNIGLSFRTNCSSSSFQKPTAAMNVECGFPQFVTTQLLFGGQYVRDDCIFVKISVDNRSIQETLS